MRPRDLRPESPKLGDSRSRRPRFSRESPASRVVEGSCPRITPGPDWSPEPRLWGFGGGLKLSGVAGLGLCGRVTPLFLYSPSSSVEHISRKPLVGRPGLSPQVTAFPSEKRPDFPDIKTAAGIKRNSLDKSRLSGLLYPMKSKMVLD